jgi:hypothetical protein
MPCAAKHESSAFVFLAKWDSACAEKVTTQLGRTAVATLGERGEIKLILFIMLGSSDRSRARVTKISEDALDALR